MYSYTYDSATGGILLNSTPTGFSKEPRPVYAAEMDILGFDAYWDFEKQNDTPYMWAESNIYWYRGVQIAKIKGGDLYTKPDLEPTVNENGLVPFGKQEGVPLQVIDIPAMCAANAELMQVIENVTVKRIVKEYEKFKDKLDIFEVAFSGGKDSAVLLDLTRKALPKGSFVVIFGDTGMEFPDTYKVVEETKRICEEEGTPFYEARSHFTPDESWNLFGPPARVLRWCCSVHKSTPQTIKLRELTGKSNFTGMDFVGVRAHESIARSKYDYENFSKKVHGQNNYNPILEWTSAEIWLYIFANAIQVNEAYKKGNSRAGCLFCPMGGDTSDYFRMCAYPLEIKKYIDRISNSFYSDDEKLKRSYVYEGGWHARVNGSTLKDNAQKYIEVFDKDIIKLKIVSPSADWKEWIKTIGTLSSNGECCSISFEGSSYLFNVHTNIEGYIVSFPSATEKENPRFVRLLKQVFKKAAYCGACQVCEANCHNGCISFSSGHLQIDNCKHCYACHDIDSGCLLYRSKKMQETRRGNMKNINTMNDHAPKRDWLVSFFDIQADFFTDHTLGSAMINKFKRFLKDAELSTKNDFSPFAQLIKSLGWDSATALGLIMVNLVHNNPQFEWYVKTMDIDVFYDKKDLQEMALSTGLKERSASQVVLAYRQVAETPFNTSLNFGYVMDDDLVRTKWTIEDNRIILYAFYKFMEKCNMDKEFHLSYLFDEDVERDGVSPVRMFGLYDEEDLKSRLLGLSAAYPDFINATFTNDLKTITLRDKISQDVLDLFREDM